MLPSGMESLTDPCLSDDWNAYSAYAGLFAMLAILAMQLIEFIAHHQLHGIPKKDNDVRTEENVQPSASPSGEHYVEAGHSHGVSLLQESKNHKISTYLLEFGVALHSVLIGVALGTTDGLNFVPLFIALCFHQFFEAIALGAQIERLDNKSLVPAIVMIIFFALTTPIGIAIGIGIHSGTYNPKSLAALMVNGVLDSVSAGILIYIALINLMAGEMGVQAHAFFLLKKRFKFLYFASLYLGAAAMAVIGRWA